MHQGRRPSTYTFHKNLTKERWNRRGFLLNIKNKDILKINLNTHSKHKHQAGAWRIKQKEGMKSEFNQFNFNTEVGWIAPNGINNGEDHTGLVDLTLKIISARINYTAQESTEWGFPLTSDISWGSVPLTEQAVGVDLPPATHHWSPRREQTGCACDALTRTHPLQWWTHKQLPAQRMSTLCLFHTHWLRPHPRQTSEHNQTLCSHLAGWAHRCSISTAAPWAWAVPELEPVPPSTHLASGWEKIRSADLHLQPQLYHSRGGQAEGM